MFIQYQNVYTSIFVGIVSFEVAEMKKQRIGGIFKNKSLLRGVITYKTKIRWKYYLKY